MMALHWLGMMLAALALVGCCYQLFAAFALKRFFARPCSPAAPAAAVTILKPLHDNEPELAANLATFLDQDYAAQVQLLCGVSDPQDPAIGVVKRLQAEHPGSIDLVIDLAAHGANAKIGNLINMLPSARHDILILSDSDMAAGRDYLATIVSALNQPGVGAVTCLYRGRADAGIWSEIAAGTISYCGLPDMIVGLTARLAHPCMGSTIALRRETLEAIGGFERFSDVLADDHALGQAVREAGLRIAVPPMLLVHACAEPSARSLWQHELRWATTIRSLQPFGYAGSIVTNPLPLAILACALLGTPGVVLILFSLMSRANLAHRVNWFARASTVSFLFLPVIDCFKFVVFIASFFVGTVDWRGARYTMDGDGGISARKAKR